MRLLRQIERSLLILGILLVGIFLAAYLDRQIFYRAELNRFREIQRAANPNGSLAPSQTARVDFSLWSEKRIAAYNESLRQSGDAPVALLRVSKVNLQVPVLEGTSEFVLNRAVGHIPGTDVPGSTGNIGIAGHRDGFFRALKDVGVGDTIDLETQSGTDVYRVEQVFIVMPNDASVLYPRSTPSLTLVTCYPFYFVGTAPKRYIVQASLVSSTREQPVAQQLPSRPEFEAVQKVLSSKSKSQPRR